MTVTECVVEREGSPELELVRWERVRPEIVEMTWL